jgi:hypothetical protein
MVQMTGPHMGTVKSYLRAVSLSCNMAHNRKRHLYIEALPPSYR